MQRKISRRRRRGGFTLMEVLLVVAILLILAGLATVAITRTYGTARANAARLDINSLKQANKMYYLDIGSYPQSLEALVVQPEGLANPAKWAGPYLEKGTLPVDPWNNQYNYTLESADRFVIWSIGPDGIADSGDEITSDQL